MVFFRRKLSNGANLIGDVRDSPAFSISTGVPYGSRNDPLGKSGLAHFLEHVLFKGRTDPEKINLAKSIEDFGGSLNANTFTEITSVNCTVPREKIDLAIYATTALLNKPHLTKKEFETEREVIYGEIGMYHDDLREYVTEELTQACLYDGLLSRSILGSERDLRSISSQDLIDFWKMTYCPANYAISAVGNFDLDELESKLEERIRSIDCGDFIKRPVPRARIIPANKDHREYRGGLDRAHIGFAVHSPPQGSRLQKTNRLLEAYLTEGFSSYLFEKIREEHGKSYVVEGEVLKSKSHGWTVIYLAPEQKNVNRIFKIIEGGFRAAASMDRKEFEKIKEKAVWEIKCEEERVEESSEEMLYEESLGRGAEQHFKRIDKYTEIRLEDFRSLAKLQGVSKIAILPK
ncbi:insulinase family protein [Candidatus Pacearchaeota archaeon]|nr:insulinase family protein [Candidatus Pacearchaeota archaeon]